MKGDERGPVQISDRCAACGKENTWQVWPPLAAVEVLQCRFCRQSNHIITAGNVRC